MYDLVTPEDIQNFQDLVKSEMEEIPFSNTKSYENKQALTRKLQRMKTMDRNSKPPLLHLGSTTTKSKILKSFQHRGMKEIAKRNLTVHKSDRKNKSFHKAQNILTNLQNASKDDTCTEMYKSFHKHSRSFKSQHLGDQPDEDKKIKVMINKTLDYYN